jgi:hypothetical protein
MNGNFTPKISYPETQKTKATTNLHALKLVDREDYCACVRYSCANVSLLTAQL